MKNVRIDLAADRTEFRRFTNFFIKYLNGSASNDEAFVRTASTYRKLFKKIPYKSSQGFFEDFRKSEFAKAV